MLYPQELTLSFLMLTYIGLNVIYRLVEVFEEWS
jgi:hypothetical protein